MAFKETDPVLFMQTQISRLYRQRYNIGIREFNDLDRKIDLLGFIEIGYESFHLTGEEGILDEVDDYCRKRLAVTAEQAIQAVDARSESVDSDGFL